MITAKSVSLLCLVTLPCALMYTDSSTGIPAPIRRNLITLDDLPLDRAVHFVLPLHPDWSADCPLPATIGLAITELSAFPFHRTSNQSLVTTDVFAKRARIRINNEDRAHFMLTDTGVPERVTFNPPLIVRPGDLFSVSLFQELPGRDSTSSLTPPPEYPINTDQPAITVGAWVLYPGEI